MYLRSSLTIRDQLETTSRVLVVLDRELPRQELITYLTFLLQNM